MRSTPPGDLENREDEAMDADEMKKKPPKVESVYKQKPNAPKPSAMYVYYLKKHDQPYEVHFFDDKPTDDMQEAVDAAVKEIQAGRKPTHESPGVVWDRPGYLVFDMTRDQGRLKKGDGVRFGHQRTGKNHTFFNGTDLDDVHGCSAMYCINFRKNQHGRDLGASGKESETFDWVAGDDHSSQPPGQMRSHNSSDTNTGP